MSAKPDLPPASDAEGFVEYYAGQSLTPEAKRRSQRIFELVTRVVGRAGEKLDVADIGCGPGAQSLVWALAGHRVHGVDINEGLLALARKRADEAGFAVDFCLGSATNLPFADASMDVCLAPEILEHVPDWQACLREFSRILRPGGVLYLSTTNRLCPVQMEYNLPLYSWYPSRLKRHCERLAVTTRREWVSYATYPAVHWFTFYELRDFLLTQGVDSMDRFDQIEVGALGPLGRSAVRAIRGLAPLRWFGHVLTPWSMVVGVKQGV